MVTRNMKKKSLFVLLLAAMLCCTSCIDNNYDLSNIDTNSRFNINGLTVPFNMDPVKLDLMLDISDDSDIKTDSEGNYYFRKEGSFTSKSVNISKITISKPKVEIEGTMGINILLPPYVKEKLEEYAGNITVGDLLSNPQLMSFIGITADSEIMNVNFDNSKTAYEISFNATNIDANVKGIETIGFDKTKLAIEVNVNGLENVVERIAIKNLTIVMPKGFSATTSSQITYNPEEGTLTSTNESIQLDNKFFVDLSIMIDGINYAQFAEGGMKVFDPVRHTFSYKKVCSASGNAILTLNDLKRTAKLADVFKLELPDAVAYDCSMTFDKDLSVNSFKGDITYSMDDILVDPIALTGIPDILKEVGTNIDLKNPQIYLNINNHLNEYGIKVNSNLEIKGNNSITAPLNVNETAHTYTVMSPFNEGLYHPQGYVHEEVKSLGGVVGSNDGQSFPEYLNIRVIKPHVPEIHLQNDFELGKNLQGIDGTWEFYTRLALTDNTKIKYTKQWDDWGSDDLNGLTVNKATVNVTVTKDIAMDAESLEFVLFGKKGELRGETSLTGDATQNIVLDLKGMPVSEIQGGKINVHLRGLNKDLNRNQQIEISNLKVMIDGYYDRQL